VEKRNSYFVGSPGKTTLTPITEFCGFFIKKFVFGYDSCWPCWYVVCSNKLTYSISFQVVIEYDSFKIKINFEIECHMTPFLLTGKYPGWRGIFCIHLQ